MVHIIHCVCFRLYHTPVKRVPYDSVVSIPYRVVLITNELNEFLFLARQTDHFDIKFHRDIARDARLARSRGTSLGTKGQVALWTAGKIEKQARQTIRARIH
jgi:hypothetical protein